MQVAEYTPCVCQVQCVFVMRTQVGISARRCLVDCHGEILLLMHWSMLGRTAITKLLKKHAKLSKPQLVAVGPGSGSLGVADQEADSSSSAAEQQQQPTSQTQLQASLYVTQRLAEAISRPILCTDVSNSCMHFISTRCCCRGMCTHNNILVMHNTCQTNQPPCSVRALLAADARRLCLRPGSECMHCSKLRPSSQPPLMTWLMQCNTFCLLMDSHR